MCRLLTSAIEAVPAQHCSAPSRDAVLDMLESLLDADESLLAAVLLPHTSAVLQALKAIVLRVLSPGHQKAPQESRVCIGLKALRLLRL
jgi:hypothetical protein